MVAITVILAAVIGAFVLEIGDQQETAPNTSFESTQTTDFYQPADWSYANLTAVEFNHVGGDVVPISQVEIVVEGNTSVWGSTPESPKDGTPTPDFLPTLGTNEPATFTSGDSWRLHSFSQEGVPDWRNGMSDDTIREINHDCGGTYVMHYVDATSGYKRAYLHDASCSVWSGGHGFSHLEQGHQPRVVWEAESGGKTQTLFEYTVQ
jgi:FlaG/FlaF family flagellin (archaellin)